MCGPWAVSCECQGHVYTEGVQEPMFHFTPDHLPRPHRYTLLCGESPFETVDLKEAIPLHQAGSLRCLPASHLPGSSWRHPSSFTPRPPLN